MNYYNEEYTFSECYIVSTKLGPAFLISNCPKMYYYLGTGYFNADGFLIAIHKCGMKYNNGLSERNQFEMKFFEEDQKEIKYDDESSEIEQDGKNTNPLKNIIKFNDESSARNPRSILVDAKYLIKLYQSNKKRSR